MATISGEQSCGSAINVSANVGVVLNSCTRSGNNIVVSINAYLYQTTSTWSSNSWSIFINGTEYTVFNSNSGAKHTSQNTKYYTGNISLTLSCTGTSTTFGVGVNGLSWNPSSASKTFTFTISSVDPATYTISYNANGGSGAPGNQTKNHDVALTLSSTKPTRGNSTANGYVVTFNGNGGTPSKTSATATNTTSYTFKNWNTAAGGSGTAYNAGASYTANASATLYAQWNSSTAKGSITTATATRGNSTANGYTITFDANGGVCSTASLVQKNTNSYTFKRWNTNTSDNGTAYNGNTSITPSGNITLYAIWNTTTTAGSIALPTPSRGDYDFLGWGTSSTATSGVTGNYTPTSTRTLYAVWRKIPRLINWRDSNGNFTSGGTVSVRDANGNWVVIDKINIRNSSGQFEEH